MRMNDGEILDDLLKQSSNKTSTEQVSEEVQHVFETFWKDIIMNEDGTVNLNQVKKELSDFSFMIDQVPRVYEELAGLSKPNYYADTIIGLARERQEEHLKEDLQELVNEMVECETVDEVLEIFRDAYGIVPE